MPSRIIEFFGHAPDDRSASSNAAREGKHCPFIDADCQKTLSDGTISGACTLQSKTGNPVICCPQRLYADHYKVLTDVAQAAFKQPVSLSPGSRARRAPVKAGEARVAVFGKRWGKELRLPSRGTSGSYFVDWVLARLDDNGNLAEFVAVEVQSIDTTGNYQAERRAYANGHSYDGWSTAGFNWENVNKRILPQIIYKGHVLRRENLCTKGLFFVCPTPVFQKIRERLGGKLLEYQLQTGALTFIWYDVGPPTPHGQVRALVRGGSFTTTVDQVALAFTSPSNLPNPNVYEAAIRAELNA